jgi:hypothetical protein
MDFLYLIMYIYHIIQQYSERKKLFRGEVIFLMNYIRFEINEKEISHFVPLAPKFVLI